jgi:hypothetical protein
MGRRHLFDVRQRNGGVAGGSHVVLHPLTIAPPPSDDEIRSSMAAGVVSGLALYALGRSAAIIDCRTAPWTPCLPALLPRLLIGLRKPHLVSSRFLARRQLNVRDRSTLWIFVS